MRIRVMTVASDPGLDPGEGPIPEGWEPVTQHESWRPIPFYVPGERAGDLQARGRAQVLWEIRIVETASENRSMKRLKQQLHGL